MPKKGYKSITFSDEVYGKMFEMYQKDKTRVSHLGINNFNGYVAYRFFKEKS